MALEATPYASLPITDEAWDPGGKGKNALLNEVLGDDDWARYKKAHLIWDPDNDEVLAGYKLPIARMVGGQLKAIRAQIGAAIAAINGARTPLAVPDTVRRKAYDNAIKYLKKAGIEEEDLPEFKASLEQRITVCSKVVLESEEEKLDKPQWQHIATEGEYKGYGYGELPFTFTVDTFKEIIKNFRNDPAYKAGENGIGIAPVVPWDFNHATDADPALVAVEGNPAQGWVFELAIKTDKDGKAQLWALSQWHELAREYIKNGQYRWASVSVWLNALDQHSGERLGALLTSVAITNTPFIPGLEQLAASRESSDEKIIARRYFYESADSPIGAAGFIKDLLGLRETDSVTEIISEIAKMRQWIEINTIPLGIDMDHIIGSMRKILSLPTLMPALEVLDEANKITGALLADQAPTPGQETEAPNMASMNEGEDDMDLLKTLAEKLGVREVDTEVVAAAHDSVQLRNTLKEKLGVSKDTTNVLLAEVTEAIEAKVNLSALYGSLEATKQSEATDKVVALLDKAKKWDEAEVELTKLRDKIAAEEKVKAEADVDEVMKAHKIPDQVKPALLLERTQDPDGFAKRFPPLGDDVALTQKIAAGKGAQLPEATPEQQGEVIDLSDYPGRNRTNRMMSWVRGNIKGADQWDEDTVWTQACILGNTKNIVGL
jgi:hypothetical protein